MALLMVPVVSVLALWAFATVTTAQDVWNLLRLRAAHATVLTPIGDTVAGLQAERTAAGQLLAAPGAARESALREAAATTDRALDPLLLGPPPRDRAAAEPLSGGESGAASESVSDPASGAVGAAPVARGGQGYNRADAEGLGPDAAARLDALGTAVAALPALRTRILARAVGWPEAYAAYGTAVDRALAVSGALTPLQDHRVASDARVLLEFARSRELLAREDALLRAAQLSGGLGEDQLREFAGTVLARRRFEQGSAADLRPQDRSALLAVTGGPDHRDLTGYEDRVRTAPDGRAAVVAVAPERWSVAAGNVARDLRAVEDAAGRAAAEREDPYALGLFTPSGIAVLLGLAAVLASLVISVRIGRGLVTELIGLRNSALELAGRKLPATMRRLRSGEEVDIESEAPLPAHGSDEIGQVHGALGTVQRAAVTAAVERAEVLSGVSGVFVNLARRSQVLVHRQLTLLDTMERRTEDPSELADLFRLDHLTTRMRRHAEGLIILSGAAPGRAWRRPVPLLDVVRAAVSEVEEYARVEVHRLPPAAVTGQAVADLTHLVAELVENATGFSPPHTRVHIRGEQVGNGYAVEIEDRGLGMGGEALADANRRIAAAGQADLFDSDRLGLFVVSRLARRHGIRVSLQTSAYGGTTAVVLLPTALLAEDRPGGSLPEGSGLEGSGPEGSRPVEWWEPVDAVPELDIDSPPDRPPFGARSGDPGVLRPTPFRASGARTDGPAVDGPPVADRRPKPGPGPVVRAVPAPQPLSSPQSDVAQPAFGRRTGQRAEQRAEQRPERRPEQRPERLTEPPTEGVTGPDELPRRIRQASLVPQLREAPPAPAPGTRRAASAPGRPPEAARAAMSAYQQGWARGERPAAPESNHQPQGPEGERR
ncbi:nitrate- and nitrite sensing domain-containing protein [Kitasatospora sp. NPDC058170]|uniref:sensor histidine kinase n=1 Tax=Kitasatospora sp. NPDC058170 TaxID=3346364 RepID=UPI0036D8736D